MDTEKDMVARRFRGLQQIGRLLRCLEAAGALLLLSYSSSYLPEVARNSGAILRRAAAVLISPSFGFLLGNAIVLVLFVKSGQIVSSSESETSTLCAEDRSIDMCCDASYLPPPHLSEAEEVVFEDKAVCVEIRALPSAQPENLETEKEEATIRRTEKTFVDAAKPPPPPPEVEIKEVAAQDRADGEGEEDAEQFRRTIEEFIAKQQRFQRQESLTVVPYSAGLPEPVAV